LIETTSIVIMASGFSKRMGKSKLFLPIHKKTFLEHTIDRALAAGFYEVIVVIQPEDAKRCQFPAGVKVTLNYHSKEGQSSSVRLGTATAMGKAILFCPIDQPLLTIEGLQKIADHGSVHHIVVPFYQKIAKGPVCFGSDYFSELTRLTGDEGGRSVRDRHKDKWICLEFADNQLLDIDSPEAYDQFIAKSY